MSLFKRSSTKSKSSSHLPAKLQDDTLKFKVIIDSIEEGVILIDSEGTVQLMNPGAATICGWKIDEATSISADTVVKLVDEKGETIPIEKNPLQQAFTTAKSVQSDDFFLSKRDDTQTPVSINVSPLLDGDSVTAAVAVISNISQKKAQEQQRADFISTASHEMRTPVAAIEGYLALALNENVATIDNRARDFLQKAHMATQHLGQLFQDLLTSAKAEDGRLTSHPSVVELGEFLEQLSSDFQLVAERKGLSVEYMVGGGGDEGAINATGEHGGERVVRPLYYVHVDPDRLREVITNLFDNAVKYTPEGKISIGLTGNDQVVQCYLRDTGPGIPAEDLPHLFQKFYRVDNSATRTIGGTGLGLFISRKIIELYNGRIWAKSEVGKGSSFFINLPRLSNQKAAELKQAQEKVGALSNSVAA